MNEALVVADSDLGRKARVPSRWHDLLGVLWVVGAAFVALVPALVNGPNLGPYDLLAQYGLTAHLYFVHNAVIGDISDEVLPWIQAAWLQVHHGHLPLWVQNEALGMPLAFNFGSGAFSFPALVSYLMPLSLVLWVQVLVSLVVGGTGAYFFGRVLRLHPMACAFAGTTWVLSGPLWGYLGLPDTSVMSWAGWQFAAVVLILRGKHRFWSVVLFAVSFAFSLLAGNPQIEVIILVPLAVFALVLFLWRRFVVHDDSAILRPIVDLVLAGIAGVGLSAPLLLPGLQLTSGSVRTTAAYIGANPPSQVLGLIFQSFWGQPLSGSFLNGQGFYVEGWVYVGVLAVVLAVVAMAIRWRTAEVAGLAVAAVVAMVISIAEPVDRLLNALPQVGDTLWRRSLIPLAFCVAMLAGVGLDIVLRRDERRPAVRWALGALGATALLLALVWLFGRGSLPHYAAVVRAQSFIWPAVSTAVGVASFIALAVVDRRSNPAGVSTARAWSPRTLKVVVLGIAGALLATQTVFLVVNDAPIPSSSPTTYPKGPAVTALERAVGSSVVGLGTPLPNSPGLGLKPDANIAYGIDEFAVYDPITPLIDFTAWNSQNGHLFGSTITGYKTATYIFAPPITSAQLARRYGISYVLEPRGLGGPTGAVFDRHVGSEDLYRIPGASVATLVPTSSTAWPAADAAGHPVRMTWPGPSRIHLVTHSSTAGVLRLRVTKVPGWSAEIDGRPLALSPYLSTMYQARVPAGRHVIELHYWPRAFTEGLVIAGCTVIALVVVGFVARRRRLSSRTSNDTPEDGEESDSRSPVATLPHAVLSQLETTPPHG